jgi:hypothetical protein
LAVSWEHGQENNMIDTTHKLVPAPADSLHDELRALIASSRQRLAQRGTRLRRGCWFQSVATADLGQG